MAVTQQMEEYLACIYRIASEEKRERVSTGEVARALSVSAASATYMFKRLSLAGLVHYEGYSGAALTPLGLAMALRIIRTHRMTERILTDLFHFGWEEVDALAQQLESVMPDAVIDRAEELLGQPLTCPHGHPIPRKDGTTIEYPTEPLSSVPPGESREIARIDDDDPSLLVYLAELGLVPGRTVRVVEVNALDHTMVIDVEGTESVIGERIYKPIAVRIPGARPIIKPLPQEVS